MKTIEEQEIIEIIDRHKKALKLRWVSLLEQLHNNITDAEIGLGGDDILNQNYYVDKLQGRIASIENSLKQIGFYYLLLLVILFFSIGKTDIHLELLGIKIDDINQVREPMVFVVSLLWIWIIFNTLNLNILKQTTREIISRLGPSHNKILLKLILLNDIKFIFKTSEKREDIEIPTVLLPIFIMFSSVAAVVFVYYASICVLYTLLKDSLVNNSFSMLVNLAIGTAILLEISSILLKLPFPSEPIVNFDELDKVQETNPKAYFIICKELFAYMDSQSKIKLAFVQGALLLIGYGAVALLLGLQSLLDRWSITFGILASTIYLAISVQLTFYIEKFFVRLLLPFRKSKWKPFTYFLKSISECIVEIFIPLLPSIIYYFYFASYR